MEKGRKQFEVILTFISNILLPGQLLFSDSQHNGEPLGEPLGSGRKFTLWVSCRVPWRAQSVNLRPDPDVSNELAGFPKQSLVYSRTGESEKLFLDLWHGHVIFAEKHGVNTMEGILWGLAGGGVVVLASRARALFRPPRGADRDTKLSLSSIPSRLTSCWSEKVESTRELFAECKAEYEAARVAIEEVRNPSSDKVVRIY